MSPETFRWVLTALLVVISALLGIVTTFFWKEREATARRFDRVEEDADKLGGKVERLQTDLQRNYMTKEEGIARVAGVVQSVNLLATKIDRLTEALWRHMGGGHEET